MLRSFLSSEGYLKVQSIIALEAVLREIERWDERDPERYWFSCSAIPGKNRRGESGSKATTSRCIIAVIKGRFVSSTPTFLGANPAEVRSGPKKGARALAAEEDTARTLLDSLTPPNAARRSSTTRPTATS